MVTGQSSRLSESLMRSDSSWLSLCGVSHLKVQSSPAQHAARCACSRIDILGVVSCSVRFVSFLFHLFGSGFYSLLSNWNATVFWIQQTPLQHDWSFTTPIFKISMFYPIFPVISRTRTLIGWTHVLSLINTCGSILTVKTLLGVGIFQTLPAGLIFHFHVSNSVIEVQGKCMILNEWMNFNFRQEISHRPSDRSSWESCIIYKYTRIYNKNPQSYSVTYKLYNWSK